MYYTWTPFEVREILSNEEAEVFCQYYGVKGDGNFEGRNVLYVLNPIDEYAEGLGMPEEEVEAILERSRVQLLKRRGFRTRPFKDDKVLCSWNGLAIDAMAKGGSILGKETYTQAALKTAEFLYTNLGDR
jgi:uncharacterized protein YyaL (SSP411 family)